MKEEEEIFSKILSPIDLICLKALARTQHYSSTLKGVNEKLLRMAITGYYDVQKQTIIGMKLLGYDFKWIKTNLPGNPMKTIPVIREIEENWDTVGKWLEEREKESSE